MAVNVMCLTSGGGIPIFGRHKGKLDQIPFSVVASLNGVHLFGKSQGVTFINTKSECCTVVWKEFEESLMLIALSILNEEFFLNHLLDLVFNAMILSVGLEELKSLKNVERLKRELRSCYPIVDKLIDCMDYSDKSSTVDLLEYCEVTKLIDNTSLKDYLMNYAESCGSTVACLVSESSLATCTDGWWQLSSIERKLILFLAATNTNSSCFDIPVFLPQKNPLVCVRVIGVRLDGRLTAVCVCGPQPDILAAQQLAYQIWAPALDMFTSAVSPNPNHLNMHSSILGYLIIDLVFERYAVYMVSPVNRKDGRTYGEVLRTFYYHSGAILSQPDSTCVESYWCSEYHKVHALKKDNKLMCVLYTAALPTHTMRTVTLETLELVT